MGGSKYAVHQGYGYIFVMYPIDSFCHFLFTYLDIKSHENMLLNLCIYIYI